MKRYFELKPERERESRAVSEMEAKPRKKKGSVKA